MTKNNPEERPMGKWVSYRPEIKILDCTIRDGGLMNNHLFDDEIVKAVYSACVDAGVDYMEIGYINSKRIFSPAEHGAWKYCREDDIRRIVGDVCDARSAVLSELYQDCRELQETAKQVDHLVGYGFRST